MYTLEKVETDSGNFHGPKLTPTTRMQNSKFSRKLKDDNKDFRLVQNFTMGESDFNQFMRLRIYLVTTAENFDREQTLSHMHRPNWSKEMDEKLKMSHRVVDIVYCRSRKTW